MAGKDIIAMSQKELSRIHIINKIITKAVTQVEASKLLKLTTRQLRRITKRILKEGDKGIAHRSRGRPSPRTFPKHTKDKILKLCQTKYEGFSPTFAAEKLLEINKIKVSRETLRGWFKQEAIPYKSRKKRPHRSWRERRHFFGQMQQIDGSHHAWFEQRGPQCVLMGYIDDANNNVFARFYDYEGTFPFMDSFKRYAKKYGLPQSIYIDRHRTYKSTKESSIEDQLNNKEPQSQVQRALAELEVEVNFAHSAPAKGRIERLFRTFQDRLVKELRLKGIKDVKQANRFLKYYLPGHNRKFKVEPIEKGDLHRPLPKNMDLDKALCIKTKRGLNNDSTVAYDKKLFLVLDKTYTKHVFVEERINGKMLITHNGKSLNYKQITKQSVKPKAKKGAKNIKPKKLYIPPHDHPYKSFKVSPYTSYLKKEQAAQKEKELLLVH